MKSTFFNEILVETTMQVNDSYQGAINKLRLQNGRCSNRGKNGEFFRFKCSVKGKMTIDNDVPVIFVGGSKYYAAGEVLVEDKKTVVRVYSAHNRLRLAVRIFITFLFALLLIAGIQTYPFTNSLLVAVLKILCIAVMLVCDIVMIVKEGRKKTTDLELMKDEIIKRVEAINHWEK